MKVVCDSVVNSAERCNHKSCFVIRCLEFRDHYFVGRARDTTKNSRLFSNAEVCQGSASKDAERKKGSSKSNRSGRRNLFFPPFTAPYISLVVLPSIQFCTTDDGMTLERLRHHSESGKTTKNCEEQKHHR